MLDRGRIAEALELLLEAGSHPDLGAAADALESLLRRDELFRPPPARPLKLGAPVPAEDARRLDEAHRWLWEEHFR